MATLNAQDCIEKLLGDLIGDPEHCYGLGSMTCSVYDTAWVACVSKTVQRRSQWLFPSSFSFILSSQLPDGRWPAHPCQDDTDEVDGILSTLAALFCLTGHAKRPLQLRHLHGKDLSARIDRGVSMLSTMLRSWRVCECKAVGFEVLVPSLLGLLESEGISFDFPDKAFLLNIRDQKLAKVKPEMLYKNAPFTLLHSLEAFHGRQDFSFDRIAHHKIGGSMMASPSATSSYLIRASVWDDEAEAYLRLAISNGEGHCSGGVPSAYPSTNFEISWVVSTLLEAGVWSVESSSELYKQMILRTLDESRLEGKGLVGFAPGIEPDLDDSAKASIIFSLLDRSGFTSQIVEFFHSAQWLKTYRAERDPSVSANCNALLSIVLDSDEYSSKLGAIEKVATFICNCWRNSNGLLNDKWNLSPLYPSMLMARSLMELLRAWDSGRYSQLSRELLRESVVPTLFQCLTRTLQLQREDGSWGYKGPREETSYAILTLTSLLALPVAQPFRPQMDAAISRGREYLRFPSAVKPEYLWIEKVSYGSKNLANAYWAAALYTSIDVTPFRERVPSLCDPSPHSSTVRDNMLTSGKSKDYERLVLASAIEARLWLPQLQKGLDRHCPSWPVDHDLEATAFQWILASNRLDLNLSPQLLCDIISASAVSERLIAWVEGPGGLHSRSRLDAILATFQGVANGSRKRKLDVDDELVSVELHANANTSNGDLKTGKTNHPLKKLVQNEGDHVIRDESSEQPSIQYDDNESTAISFLRFFQDHPSLTGADEEDKIALRIEIESFVLAQALSIQEQEKGPAQVDRNDSSQLNGNHHTTHTNRQEATDCHEEHMPQDARQLAGLSGYRHLITFARCLGGRKEKGDQRSMGLGRVMHDLNEAVVVVAQANASLREPRSGDSVISYDEILEQLEYERAKIGVSLDSLERLGVGQEALKMIRLVVEVAELQRLGGVR